VHSQTLEDLQTRSRAEALELQLTVRELRARLESGPIPAGGVK
jgi:hypothetical protein